jgi:hypothetical protein
MPVRQTRRIRTLFLAAFDACIQVFIDLAPAYGVYIPSSGVNSPDAAPLSAKEQEVWATLVGDLE